MQVLDQSTFELEEDLVRKFFGAGRRSSLWCQEGTPHHVEKFDEERQELSRGRRALLVGAEQNLDGGLDEILGGEEGCGEDGREFVRWRTRRRW